MVGQTPVEGFVIVRRLAAEVPAAGPECWGPQLGAVAILCNLADSAGCCDAVVDPVKLWEPAVVILQYPVNDPDVTLA